MRQVLRLVGGEDEEAPGGAATHRGVAEELVAREQDHRGLADRGRRRRLARGTLGATRIGAGTKIDSLSHIAHNCDIGKHCAITALVGFAGSVTFKDHVSVGGMAGFAGHITVGENTVVMAKAGVTKDIPANSVVSGFPAIDHKKELEQQAALRRLPEVIKELKSKQ